MSESETFEKSGSRIAAYAAVAFVSGAIIAYELFVMRVFSNGGWGHFGSTVISIAMFGFGVFSTVLCIWKNFFKARLNFWISVSLVLLGPLMIAANTLAQSFDFNPIFLVSDPRQKYFLACYFLLYFLPFLVGAMFLGFVFLKGQNIFGRIYFANMFGSGLGGMAIFAAMYFIFPEKLFVVPLALWLLGALCWQAACGNKKFMALIVISAGLSLVAGLEFSQINVSPYKSVSYARKFPDTKRIYHQVSPFGNMEVYSSSFFHFAPGLSDMAALQDKEMPDRAYLGMYIDGDGPIGVMKKLSEAQSWYFRFLSMAAPYLLKTAPDVFIMQFGGGISTNVALGMGAGKITVSEGNPMVVKAVRDNESIADFTGRILENKNLALVPSEGRIFIGRVHDAFDIIDISLADSTGLSMPGGYSISEKYSYTRETFRSCIKALRQGGILSVTVWNKEDPPKSTLRLLATMIPAAGEAAGSDVKHSFFIFHTYLSTLTVLYRKGGFAALEIEKLHRYCKKMSFETIYFPGMERKTQNEEMLFKAYRDVYFSPREEDQADDQADMTAGNLYSVAVQRLMAGDFKYLKDNYVFDIEPLTNNKPYFAGFIKIRDIPKFIDKLEVVSDEWGYLLLWATLLQALVFSLIIILLPMIFGWRAIFSRKRGKTGVILYFLCLGLGYMFIEISLISKYVLILGNPTVSVAMLITGMLVFSGLGSLASERFVPAAKRTVVIVSVSIAAILLLYALFMNPILYAFGVFPYPARILLCLALLFPPAFLMGFPFALGMSCLAKLNKEHFFVWAWGINGSFSVVGSVLVPILSVLFGISSILLISAVIYLIALPAFFSLVIPDEKI